MVQYFWRLWYKVFPPVGPGKSDIVIAEARKQGLEFDTIISVETEPEDYRGLPKGETSMSDTILEKRIIKLEEQVPALKEGLIKTLELLAALEALYRGRMKDKV